MEGIQRLQRLYTIAKVNGVCKNKREFADSIHAGYTTLVRTMNGEKYYSPNKCILAAEDMLRERGIDTSMPDITLMTIWNELQEQRKMLKKLLNLAEKGHISDTQNPVHLQMVKNQ